MIIATKPNRKNGKVPPLVKAIIALLSSFIFFYLAITLFSYVPFLDYETAEFLASAVYGLFIVAACYLIVQKDPSSFWYVPLIINIVGIVAAAVEPRFWEEAEWITYIITWVLSLALSLYLFFKQKKQNK